MTGSRAATSAARKSATAAAKAAVARNGLMASMSRGSVQQASQASVPKKVSDGPPVLGAEESAAACTSAKHMLPGEAPVPDETLVPGAPAEVASPPGDNTIDEATRHAGPDLFGEAPLLGGTDTPIGGAATPHSDSDASTLGGAVSTLASGASEAPQLVATAMDIPTEMEHRYDNVDFMLNAGTHRTASRLLTRNTSGSSMIDDLSDEDIADVCDCDEDHMHDTRKAETMKDLLLGDSDTEDPINKFKVTI
jgi:hypothetical protein